MRSAALLIAFLLCGALTVEAVNDVAYPFRRMEPQLTNTTDGEMIVLNTPPRSTSRVAGLALMAEITHHPVPSVRRGCR